MRPLIQGNDFTDHIQALLSTTSKLATIVLPAQRNTRIRIDQIVFGACQVPPFTNGYASARLLVFEGEMPASILTNMDVFTANWDTFKPNKILLDVMLAVPYINLPFHRGLYGTKDTNVNVMLLSPYNVADTVPNPSTFTTTLTVIGERESTQQSATKGKLVSGV